MSANMTFDVETSTHRPKYRLWLGLYIITNKKTGGVKIICVLNVVSEVCSQ